MYNATERFQLPVSEPQRLEKGDITAIWDGVKFVYQSEEGSSQWWDLAKLFWKYGLSPYKAKKIVDGMLEQFLQLYEPPYFPFKSLTQRAQELGMTELTGITGEQGLAQWVSPVAT